MKKQHKGWLIAAIALPVLAGGYLLFKYFFPMGKKRDFANPPPGASPKPALQGSPSIFPLKKGSPKSDLVKQLQAALGVTADGLFGPQTQAALVAKTGKTAIASQAEFNSVIAGLSAVSTNAARAEKLVNDWKTNSANRLIATSDTYAYQVIEDTYGALTMTGQSRKLTPGYFYNRTDYVLLSSTQQGYVKFQVTSGAGAGLYKVDASKISLG